MDKKIIIPYGHDRKEITEPMVRNAQAVNLSNMSTEGGRLIDAVLSYFIINCMTVSCKQQQQTYRKIASR